MDLESLSLREVVDWLLTSGLQIVVVILLSIIAYRLLKLITRHLTQRVKDLDDIDDSEQDRRADTIFRVVNTTGLAVIVVTALLMILNELAIDITPVLASVGVVGLAFGLGAQTLVQDVIGGIFVLVEGQYQVGDSVEIAGRVGTVEQLTLRATYLRDISGYLHIIPNGDIRAVSNRSKDWSRAIVDVGITYEDNVASAMKALEEVAALAAADEDISGVLLERPVVTGVEGLEDWQVRLRIMVRTKPGEHWGVQRYLRRLVQQVFAEHGVSLAYPRRDIQILREASKEAPE